MKISILILVCTMGLSGCSTYGNPEYFWKQYSMSQAPVEKREKLLNAYISAVKNQENIHYTPLVTSLQHKDYELFWFCLKQGENINKAEQPSGITPINVVVEMNNVNLTKKIIDAGAKPNSPLRNPLNNAVQLGEFYQGNKKMVELLLKNKARLASTKIEDTTPLFYVKNKEIAKILINNGVPVNSKRKNGATALMNTLGLCSSNKAEALQMMKLLIDNGADVNAIQTIEDETILDMAIGYDYPKEIVTFLRKHGAKTASELKKRTLRGQTP